MSQYQEKVSADLKGREYPRNTREFCRIGFNDACTNFRLQFSKYDFDILEQCIKDVESYNEYSGEKVAKAFAKIKDQVRHASFGREGSPVLYLYLVQRDWVNDELVDRKPEQIAQIVRDIKKAFKPTKVDESDQSDEGRRENEIALRLWWD